MNAKDTMLCWDPDSERVALMPWPDRARRSDAYRMSGLACYSHVQGMTFEQRKTVVFIEAMHLVVRERLTRWPGIARCLGSTSIATGARPICRDCSHEPQPPD